jgi:FHA domain-containing protein
MTQAMGDGSPAMRWSEACEPFASAALELEAEAFAARFPQTYLCFVTGDGEADTDLFGTDDAAPSYEPLRLQVLPLIKSAEPSPFSLMITFGRSPSCDLPVPFSDVSKLHGYFSRDGEGWLITDAGSTNGTFLAGSRLKPRSPAPVEVGGAIGIASLEARVLDGHALHAFLQPQPT